jgi:hypothetical protein
MCAKCTFLITDDLSIETPEGSNIGSRPRLASFATVNQLDLSKRLIAMIAVLKADDPALLGPNWGIFVIQEWKVSS